MRKISIDKAVKVAFGYKLCHFMDLYSTREGNFYDLFRVAKNCLNLGTKIRADNVLLGWFAFVCRDLALTESETQELKARFFESP